MRSLPDPIWPVLVLAFITAGDAVLCVRPAAFVADCLRGVRFPERFWWILTPLKAAAALGLLAGVWIPVIGAITAVALVAYFVVAITFHVLARDFGRYLFVNALGMLVVCLFVLWFSFVG